MLFDAFSALALVAAWLGYVAGLSFEFGAFVAGAVISEAAGSAVIASVVAPFRSLFVTLFFVSVGMLVNVSFFAAHWVLIVAAGVALAVIRGALWFALARFDAMTVAGALLVGVGWLARGVQRRADYGIGTGCAPLHRKRRFFSDTLVTMVACVLPGPLLSRLRGPWTMKRIPVDRQARPDARVALVGSGRVGQTVASVLGRAQIPYVALERDSDVVHRRREDGENVILGDALDPSAFDRLFGPEIELFVITVPETAIADILAARAKARSGARVIARAAHARDVEELQTNGASIVLVPEIEGALSFAEAALRALDVSYDLVEEHVNAERTRMRLRSG